MPRRRRLPPRMNRMDRANRYASTNWEIPTHRLTPDQARLRISLAVLHGYDMALRDSRGRK